MQTKPKPKPFKGAASPYKNKSSYKPDKKLVFTAFMLLHKHCGIEPVDTVNGPCVHIPLYRVLEVFKTSRNIFAAKDWRSAFSYYGFIVASQTPSDKIVYYSLRTPTQADINAFSGKSFIIKKCHSELPRIEDYIDKYYSVFIDEVLIHENRRRIMPCGYPFRPLKDGRPVWDNAIDITEALGEKHLGVTKARKKEIKKLCRGQKRFGRKEPQKILETRFGSKYNSRLKEAYFKRKDQKHTWENFSAWVLGYKSFRHYFEDRETTVIDTLEVREAHNTYIEKRDKAGFKKRRNRIGKKAVNRGKGVRKRRTGN